MIAGKSTVWQHLFRPRILVFAIPFILIIYFQVKINSGSGNDLAPQPNYEDFSNDHNCRLWGAISNDFPDSAIYNDLVGYPYSLKNLTHVVNSDGWGIGHYDNFGDSVSISRGSLRAYYDSLYDIHVNDLELSGPKIVVAHVRNCVSGCCCHECDSIPNPHPYRFEKNNRSWTFAHNGLIRKSLLYDLIGENYLLNNPPTGSGIPECDPSDTSLIVDSELYFIYLLKKIEESNWDVQNGIIAAVITIYIYSQQASLNFLLSDGENLWAFKKGWSLFYLYDPNNNYSAAASYIPSLGPGLWQAVNDFELVTFDRGSPPVITNVPDFFPEGFYIPGDANGNLIFNGLDVTYGVSFLKGEGPAPPDSIDCSFHGLILAAADANGSCSFNGLDIIYSVNYFKGIGEPPVSCPECPPATVF